MTAGFGMTLRAEWTKLRTVPGTVWLLAATIVLTVGVSTAAAAATRCPVGTGCPVDTTKLSLTGVQFGQAVVAILATTGITSEYSTGMIRTTIAAMPRRAGVLAAKAAVTAGPVLAAGVIAVAALAANSRWQRHLEQFGPMTAGLEIEATAGLRSLPISPWAGLDVLAAWAAAALLAGGLLIRLRDA
jgi:ABC-2 type transport system permease protein